MNRPGSQSHHLVVGALLCVLTGCHSFGPAQPETLRRIRAMEFAGQIPSEQFVIEIESPYLAGVFDVLCVIEAASVRLQLFPDVGGKVLDLTICPTSIEAIMPGSSYRAEPPFAEAAPHLGIVLAAMLAELMEPVTSDRVLAERVAASNQLDESTRQVTGQANGERIEVQLRPALGAGTVTAQLAADGQIESYQIGLGRLQFTLRADGKFAGRGFSGRLCR